MLYYTLAFGVLALTCVALTINTAWTQANVWIVPPGIVCVVIGVLMEMLRFQHAKGVAENRKGPYKYPTRDRNHTVPSGWLSMLVAVSFVALGLVLLMLQAMAFLWN